MSIAGVNGAQSLPGMMAQLLVKTLDQTKTIIAAGAAIEMQQQAQQVALDNLGTNIDVIA